MSNTTLNENNFEALPNSEEATAPSLSDSRADRDEGEVIDIKAFIAATVQEQLAVTIKTELSLAVQNCLPALLDRKWAHEDPVAGLSHKNIHGVPKSSSAAETHVLLGQTLLSKYMFSSEDEDNESDNGEIGSESDSELWLPSVLAATNKEGPPVNKVVADFVDATFKQTASEDETKGLQEKWAKLANISMLVTPRVDDSLWKKLSPYVRKRDRKIAHVQDNLIKSVRNVQSCVANLGIKR